LILCKTIGRTTSLAHISAFQLCLCRRQRGRTTHDLALRTSGLPGLPPFVVWEWTEDGNCCAVKRSVLLHSPLSMVSPFSKPMPQLPGSVQHLAQLLLRWSLAVRDRNFKSSQATPSHTQATPRSLGHLVVCPRAPSCCSLEFR
jgi:hypothetical protein